MKALFSSLFFSSLLFSEVALAAPPTAVCGDISGLPTGVCPYECDIVNASRTDDYIWSDAYPYPASPTELWVAAPSPIGGRSLWLLAQPGNEYFIGFELGGGLPEDVEMLVGAYKNDITVTAYDISDAALTSVMVVANSGPQLVSFSDPNGIAYVVFSGGEGEEYVDDICMW